MTRRILKWDIPVDDRDHPIGAGPVAHVGCQGGNAGLVTVWTDETDAPATAAPASARVYGTGQPLPDGDEAAESVIAGPFVWHVLRRRAA